MSTASSYDASAIEVLHGLDPVRKRPGMYTDTRYPNHLAHEVIDNSVDEALIGHCTEITVTHHQDGSLTIDDNGRGMPVDTHKETGRSGVEVIMTTLHAGGKFSNKQYRYAGGLHGVGISVVNALSSKLSAVIRREGKVWNIEFANGDVAVPLAHVDSYRGKQTGTTVRFWPAPQYFEHVSFHISKLKKILETKAVLCHNLTISFIDENKPELSETWSCPDGLLGYLKNQVAQEDVCVPAEPVFGNITADEQEIEYAILWQKYGALSQHSWVNLIPTEQGGSHVTGLRSGLFDALNEFIEFQKCAPRGIDITADDVLGRCSFAVSSKVAEASFSGQTKDRLNDRKHGQFVNSAVKDQMSLWLNRHVAQGREIVEMCADAARHRLAKKATVQRRQTVRGPQLPGKLADCTEQGLDGTELFLVEGDSAGGSTKQARNRRNQAILPLRGKILNTWDLDSSAALKSQIVADIVCAIGIEPNSDDLSGLRYGTVCILADADSDGLHIATLLCALFLKHFPALVRNGHCAVALPPLFRIDTKSKVFYAHDEQERDSILQGIKSKASVTRFKGLGEMNASQLRDTVMSTSSRRIAKLVLPADIEDESAHEMLDKLMSKTRSPDRRVWLETKGNLAQLL